ncbi:alpha/beta fold hydrolase [Actinomadura macra]|uniref:alpha/beta fold hydrolase n=1 Tax=Actinomadura macra TaxID=46164 RepID=UPI0008370C92|nr:alpha/beta hydrolase [Actinomadura macra]
MSALDVPGARLYYECRGSGPTFVLVPGANGDARVFGKVAEHLAEHYTVITYDRRGFSRSTLHGAQDYEHRLKTDADDVRRLIEHVGEGPATVFGTSSGGVIVLELLVRHPSVVATLAPYEPAAMKQLDDAQHWLDLLFGLYDLYRRSGIEPALQDFRELFSEADRPIMSRATNRELNEHAHANVTYWFERELRQYTTVDLDIDALTPHAGRIVLVSGEQSRGYPNYRVNQELGRKLGREVIELPGGHTGFAAHPAEFARRLRDATILPPHHDVTSQP